MNTRAFYRRQRSSNIFYAMGLIFFGLMVLVCVVAMIWFTIDEWGSPEYIWFLPMMLLFTGFFLAFFLYIKIVLGGRRKRIYKKYHAMPEAERVEISMELSQKFAVVLWGSRRVYVRSGFFFDFIDYDQMVWFYPCNTIMPMVAAYEGVSIDGQINALSVHVYDREGTRYKIPATNTYETGVVIQEILQRAPGIHYGYSKEIGKLARKDFAKFLDKIGGDK